MSLRIAHNGDALAAHRHIRVSTDRLAVAMQRLSSGLRVNSAADDASGLGISERLRGQIRSLEQANRNVQDGISLLRVAEGALETVHSILHRARELAVQYNNDTNDDNARLAINRELVQLRNEIRRIEQTTEFNGVPLLQSAMTTITLQVGANAGEVIAFNMADLYGIGTALVRPVTFFNAPGTQANIPWFDAHIADVAAFRGRLGAVANRLEHTLAANQVKIEATMSAESRIRDADMAVEMANLTSASIRQRASLAMLAQAMGPARPRMAELMA